MNVRAGSRNFRVSSSMANDLASANLPSDGSCLEVLVQCQEAHVVDVSYCAHCPGYMHYGYGYRSDRCLFADREFTPLADAYAEAPNWCPLRRRPVTVRMASDDAGNGGHDDG
jgi:hypothetical protein